MVADTLCAQWCRPRLEPWGAAGRQLSSGPVGRQMWERSPTTIRTQSGPAEQGSSYMNSVAQLDMPAQMVTVEWKWRSSDKQSKTAWCERQWVCLLGKEWASLRDEQTWKDHGFQSQLWRLLWTVHRRNQVIIRLQDVDVAKLLLLDNLKRLERRCCPCYPPATTVRLCAWEWNERLLRKLTTVITFFFFK